ncbi:MAG: sigma-70 family RNA polymerase sigma factor [Ruminococcaceae bacterium]|nr:sigma-70 family RNA polymerase sigma factor [Oscillospiraceae bacterium]
MEDSKIIALYWERNESAITQTAEKYGHYCIMIAKNILQNQQDAEECVNTAYLKAWENIPPEKPSVFSAFLAKLTRNTAIDTYRKSRSEKRGNGEIPLIYDELENLVSDKSDPVSTAERNEILSAINVFLSELPKRKRVIFVSRYCCCQSVKEIAARLGMSENNVSVNLNRIGNRLREYLLKRGHEI